MVKLRSYIMMIIVAIVLLGGGTGLYICSEDLQTVYGEENPTQVSVDGFVYDLYLNGTASLISYAGSSVDVTIPSEVTVGENTYDVARIMDSAFWNKDVRNVVISEGVGVIHSYAFAFCYSLESVSIPDSVSYIGGLAFYNCNALTNLVLSETSTYHVTDSGLLLDDSNNSVILKLSSYDVKDIVIPDGIIEIGQDAFYESGIETIALNQVQKICFGAFENCENLREIWIPSTVTVIQSSAFSGAINLSSIVIDEDNAHYIFTGGALYTKDLGELLFCSPSVECEVFTIPEPVNIIDIEAFKNCNGIQSIVLNDSLDQISSQAFYGCSSISSIIIPGSVTEIGPAAFTNCSNLENIIVEDENQYYKSIDGVLFSFDESRLLVYPSGKTDSSYIIPDSVCNLELDAFAYSTNLKTITINQSIH